MINISRITSFASDAPHAPGYKHTDERTTNEPSIGMNLFKPKSSVSASPCAAPVTGSTATATPAPGGGHGLVWVNTETHVYHKEGSRFYGATKKGKYVSEADAIKEGDRAAARGQ
jgi:hypothetical protein